MRKDNIAEYLLYMWQMEDLLRACGCNMDEVERSVVARFAPEDRPAEARWLGELCRMMLEEGVAKSGHLQVNRCVMGELTELHHALLASPKFPRYGAAYYAALPFIVELRAKSGGEVLPEVETCFNALYGELTLRLQHKEMSDGTRQAMQAVRTFVAMLAAHYAADKQGRLKMDDD